MISHPFKTFLFLILLINVFIPFVYSVTLIDYRVILTNTSPKQTLTAQCESNGASVGAYTLVPTHRASFESHVLHRNFTMFNCDRDRARCNNDLCDWRINENGLYLLDYNYVFQFPWQ
ncbi:hypothetical protein CDL12_11820 [Handroanthus impetiginosus]|uniref:S-protein homolog n=1 Tax=Handroanthus impetiginosus TaxID=429701 RepID=A0A2G9HDG7_9LAMI|nr:hypothetical protein CDL12_11820 [Handroanthus impetiginosus]